MSGLTGGLQAALGMCLRRPPAAGGAAAAQLV